MDGQRDGHVSIVAALELAARRKRAMRSRGMGYVYQPRWRDQRTREPKTVATWWISYSIHGKRHRENAHSNKEADVTKLLKLRLGQAAIGMPVGPQIERTTLGDILKMIEVDYAERSQKSRAGQARCDSPEGILRCLRQGTGGHHVGPDIGLSSRAARARREARSRELRIGGVETGIQARRSCRKIAARPEIQMLHVENARKGFFEPEQYCAVVKHLPEHLRPLAAIAYITGWRAMSELLSRQWRHVDLAKGWLRLDPGESKNGEGREFPFTPDMRSVLEAQREIVRTIEREQACVIPWVFVQPDGSRIRDFRWAWRKACRDAGVPGRLVHDFRRTAVRNLERAGVPRSAAMRMTGHKTEAVYRRYAITDSAMLQEAAVKLAAFHVADSNTPS
jgi:integrase